jgi:NADPH2:quinone reductase
MHAVFTDPTATPRLVIREVPPPVATSSTALVRVAAISLNAGETRRALAATTSYVPGWDFAGVIETAADDGSTPPAGTRVFGFILQGSWAERINARGSLLAAIPDAITFAQAAAIPVAGVTALYCLETAGPVIGRRVLITGAAGGVGRFACQLAALAGGDVVAISRRPELAARLRADGVTATIFASTEDAKAAGEYDIVLDSVGGEPLTTAISALAPHGVCVTCGNSALAPTSFDALELYRRSNTIRAVGLGSNLSASFSSHLARLADLVVRGRLHGPIDTEQPWTTIAQAADRLLRGDVAGKLVLHLADS